MCANVDQMCDKMCPSVERQLDPCCHPWEKPFFNDFDNPETRYLRASAWATPPISVIYNLALTVR